MAEVVLEHLTKRYRGGEPAVDDLSLRIADGELIALVGPSGCGKTTTLRLIAGLEEPTSGTIRIGGRIVNRVPPRDRDVAMVFQDYALYPHMTAERNMSFALRMRKVPRAEIERRVRDAAAALGITELLGRKPGTMSGGQRQRVALGRAIVRDPQCLLLDEPLSNLDAGLRAQLRAEIKALHRRSRRTIIHVTHDQEEAMTLGERIAVMNRGAIHQVGPPMEVYRKPADRFVAGFVGSPPMNFIDGRLRRVGDRMMFSDGAGFDVVVADEFLRQPHDQDDRPATLGVRPEHLQSASAGAPASAVSNTIRLRIMFAEPLGDQMNLWMQTAGGRAIVARTPCADHYAPGQEASFQIDPRDLHLFEPGACGRSLLAH